MLFFNASAVTVLTNQIKIMSSSINAQAKIINSVLHMDALLCMWNL